MPGSLGHLARRFFDFVLARPLGTKDVDVVRSWLSPAEADIFFAQSHKDQAHGFQAGSLVAARQPARIELVKAAALHDVGKRHADLGVVGRTLASLAIKLGLPMTHRMRLYRDHPALGADELESAGCWENVVVFTRWHHGPRPESITPEDWELLIEADEPPKPLVRRPSG